MKVRLRAETLYRRREGKDLYVACEGHAQDGDHHLKIGNDGPELLARLAGLRFGA